MTPRSRITLIGAGILSLSAVAFAQMPSSHGGHGMKMPADRAGLQSMLEKHFDEVDSNHDGTITPDERKAFHQGMATRMRNEMFARADTNKDSMLSRDEFNALHGPRGGQGPGPREGHKGMGHHGGPGMGMGMRMAMMHGGGAPMDINKPVTRKEFVDAGLVRFDRADTNHDGKISDQERDAARKAMRDRLAPADRPPPPPPGL